MKRDWIESMLYGALITYLPFWEPFTISERIATTIGFAVIVFLGILKIEEILEKK